VDGLWFVVVGWDEIGWENLMWEGFMGFIIEERNKFLNLVLKRDGSIKRDYEQRYVHDSMNL
jgi:hypothetical protein